MKHFVYVLSSLRCKRYYIGYTVDVERRLLEHNTGNTKSTRPFGPWKMIYFEKFDSKSEAYKREWHLKHSKGRKEKLGIIQKYGEVAPQRGPFGVVGLIIMNYSVYILESKIGKHYYIGCTTDVEKRLIEHNQGSNRSTKKYRPWRMIYTENNLEKQMAFKREWYFKHPKGYLEKLAIIHKYGEVA